VLDIAGTAVIVSIGISRLIIFILILCNLGSVIHFLQARSSRSVVDLPAVSYRSFLVVLIVSNVLIAKFIALQIPNMRAVLSLWSWINDESSLNWW
jgi:hypothetical protein